MTGFTETTFKVWLALVESPGLFKEKHLKTALLKHERLKRHLNSTGPISKALEQLTKEGVLTSDGKDLNYDYELKVKGSESIKVNQHPAILRGMFHLQTPRAGARIKTKKGLERFMARSLSHEKAGELVADALRDKGILDQLQQVLDSFKES